MKLDLDVWLKLLDKMLGLLFLGAFMMLLREVDGLQESVKKMSDSVTKLNTSLAVVLNTQHYQGETLKRHDVQIKDINNKLIGRTQ